MLENNLKCPREFKVTKKGFSKKSSSPRCYTRLPTAGSDSGETLDWILSIDSNFNYVKVESGMQKCILPAIFFLLKRILNILLFNTSKIQQAFIKNIVHYKTYEKMNDVCLESCMFKNMKCRRNKINHTLVLLSKISFAVKGCKIRIMEYLKLIPSVVLNKIYHICFGYFK